MKVTKENLGGSSEIRSPFTAQSIARPQVRLARLAAWGAIATLCLRPIIDLQGEYEGGSLNAGGIAGFFAASLLLISVFGNVQKLGRDWLPVVFTLALLVSIESLLVVTSSSPEAWPTLGRLLVGFAPLVALPILVDLLRRNRQALRRIVNALSLFSFPPIVIAWLQRFGYYRFRYFDAIPGEIVGRPSGGYRQPNSLGRLLVFLILLWGVLYLAGLARRRTFLLVGIILLSTAFITTHRTSFTIAILEFLAISSWGSFKGGLKQTSNVAMVFLASVLVLGVMGFLFQGGHHLGGQTPREVPLLVEGFRTINSDDGSFLRGRGAIWAGALTFFEDSSLQVKLVGTGYEPFEPHNDLLRILIVHGVIGLGAMLSIFVVAWRYSRRLVNRSGRFLMLCLYGFLLFFAIPLQPTAYPFFMWLWSLVLAGILSAHPLVAQIPNK